MHRWKDQAQPPRYTIFLVIRELEQNVDGFWDYCGSEAARLADRLPQPYVIDKEFIAAKLIGRWTDGSSLIRPPLRIADSGKGAGA